MNRKTILGFVAGVVITVGLLVSVPDSVAQVATGTTQDTISQGSRDV